LPCTYTVLPHTWLLPISTLGHPLLSHTNL